jgi:hypothetical protein
MNKQHSQDELFCLLDTEYSFTGLPNDAKQIKQIMFDKYKVDFDIQLINLWLEPTLDQDVEDKIIMMRVLGLDTQ